MITIKEAESSDIACILKLMLELAEIESEQHRVRVGAEELLKSGFNEEPKFGVLIAWHQNEAIGYCSYAWNYSIWEGSIFMNIDDVYVRSAYRGKKIGELLMQEAVVVCTSRGVKLMRWEVRPENIRAIDFYKRLGAVYEQKGKFSLTVES